MGKPVDTKFTENEAAQGRVEENLREAIDALRTDMTRVELWAYALLGFSRPVPGYDADEKFRLGGRPNSASKNH